MLGFKNVDLPKGENVRVCGRSMERSRQLLLRIESYAFPIPSQAGSPITAQA